MSIAVGTKAPDFTLPNQDLRPVMLSAQFGHKHVILSVLSGGVHVGVHDRDVHLPRLDKKGIERYREVLEDAKNEPDYPRLLAALAELG